MTKNERRESAMEGAQLTEQDYLLAARTKSTRTEYAKDLRYFMGAGGCIPASVDQIVNYVTTVAPTLAVATIERRLVSIHVAHVDQGFPSPVHDSRVKQLMQGVRRSLGVAQRQVKSIEKEILLDMWSAANQANPTWAARTVALFAIGWAGAFRRSELVSLTWESVTWLDSGIEILLKSSKVDPSASGFTKYIPYAHGDRCPVKALKHWQDVCGCTTGFIFKAVGQSGRISVKPLTAHGVAQIVKRIIKKTGRDPEVFSAHSLRAGFVTAGTLALVPDFLLMQVTGHKSHATLQKYVRIGKRRQIPSLL